MDNEKQIPFFPHYPHFCNGDNLFHRLSTTEKLWEYVENRGRNSLGTGKSPVFSVENFFYKQILVENPQ